MWVAMWRTWATDNVPSATAALVTGSWLHAAPNARSRRASSGASRANETSQCTGDTEPSKAHWARLSNSAVILAKRASQRSRNAMTSRYSSRVRGRLARMLSSAASTSANMRSILHRCSSVQHVSVWFNHFLVLANVRQTFRDFLGRHRRSGRFAFVVVVGTGRRWRLHAIPTHDLQRRAGDPRDDPRRRGGHARPVRQVLRGDR